MTTGRALLLLLLTHLACSLPYLWFSPKTPLTVMAGLLSVLICILVGTASLRFRWSFSGAVCFTFAYWYVISSLPASWAFCGVHFALMHIANSFVGVILAGPLKEVRFRAYGWVGAMVGLRAVVLLAEVPAAVTVDLSLWGVWLGLLLLGVAPGCLLLWLLAYQPGELSREYPGGPFRVMGLGVVVYLLSCPFMVVFMISSGGNHPRDRCADPVSSSDSPPRNHGQAEEAITLPVLHPSTSRRARRPLSGNSQPWRRCRQTS